MTAIGVETIIFIIRAAPDMATFATITITSGAIAGVDSTPYAAVAQPHVAHKFLDQTDAHSFKDGNCERDYFRFK
jgi:hypothetical protein